LEIRTYFRSIANSRDHFWENFSRERKREIGSSLGRNKTRKN